MSSVMGGYDEEDTAVRGAQPDPLCHGRGVSPWCPTDCSCSRPHAQAYGSCARIWACTYRVSFPDLDAEADPLCAALGPADKICTNADASRGTYRDGASPGCSASVADSCGGTGSVCQSRRLVECAVRPEATSRRGPGRPPDGLCQLAQSVAFLKKQ